MLRSRDLGRPRTGSRPNRRPFLVAAATALGLAALLCASLHAQLSTEDHLADPGFWPRKSHTTQEALAGSQACTACHASLSRSQALSRMAQAAMPASAASLLREHPDLVFEANHYSYTVKTHVTTDEGVSQYSVSDGASSRTFPLLWAFGAGRVGQSYLFGQQDGGLYEARVTFYQSLHNIAFTPARALDAPKSLDEAMFRSIPQAEVVRCFSCHMTGSTMNGALDQTHLVPGIKCEACHGPGLDHVNTMDASRTTGNSAGKANIFNPAELTPTESVEFCGSCHGNFWDVRLAKVTGVDTARSAPYRLVTSKCWAKGDDPRLKCTACHDPHAPLETRPAAYDAACLNCHANRGSTTASAKLLAACPRATSECITCHMPKVYVPVMKDSFTDHRIRIARAGEPFPE